MKDSIKSQYIVLSELRLVEDKIVRIQDDLDKIPIELDKLQSILKTKRDEFDTSKSELEFREKSLRESERNLKEQEERVRKSEEKLMEVKTNEEFSAAQKEVETQKKDRGGFEDKALRLMTEAEEERKRLKEAEKNFKSFEGTVLADSKQLEEERTRLSRLLDEQKEKRVAIMPRLNQDIAQVFGRVVGRVKGAPIVKVENGLCVGCNMKLRPQLYNEIIGCQVIHRCPNCGKILIVGETEAQAG